MTRSCLISQIEVLSLHPLSPTFQPTPVKPTTDDLPYLISIQAFDLWVPKQFDQEEMGHRYSNNQRLYECQPYKQYLEAIPERESVQKYSSFSFNRLQTEFIVELYQYNLAKKNMEGQQKQVPHSKFFRKPSPAQLRELPNLEHILEAFCFEKGQTQKKKKMVLTDSYFLLLQPTGQSWEPTLLKEVTNDLRFRRLFRNQDLNSKTPQYDGFALINSKGKSTSLYFQFPALAEVWLNYITKIMVEVDFHSHYQVLSRIGTGSTASVCSIRRLRDNSLFAAKVFPKSYLEKGSRRESLLSQIQLLRALDHPNIIKIYSVIESCTSLYVLTEQLFGGNLLERINCCCGLSLEQVREVMKGLLEGLAYLHKFGIMHRDIKLENVMLRSPSCWEPVLIDFGLAAFSDDEPYFHYRCGTPGYIAPEIMQMKGQQHIGVGCDIFSAGSVMHILLTNSYLFGGVNSQEIYESNKAFRFDLGEEKYQMVDPSALQLLREMLELNHNKRISASDCLEHRFLTAMSQPQEKEEVSPAATEISSPDACYYKF